MRLRRLIRVALYAVIGVVALVAIGAVVVETSWFRERVRRLAVSQAVKYLNGDLTIGRLDGSLWRGVTLENVALTQAGQVVFTAKLITVHYDPMVLARRHVAFERITIDGATLHVVEGPDGWTLANLLRTSAPSGRAPIDFSLAHIALTNSDVTVSPLRLASRRVQHLALDASVDRAAGRLRVSVTGITGDEQRSGFHLADTALQFTGGFRDVEARLLATAGATRISASVREATEPARRQFVISGDVAALDLAPLLEDERWRSDITGKVVATADLPAAGPAALSFTFAGPHAAAMSYDGREIEATGRWESDVLTFVARGAAYGARGTVDGVWRLAAGPGKAARFSGRGSFQDVNMATLPAHLEVPRLGSRLTGRYVVATAGPSWRADVTLDDSLVEGATLRRGMVGHVDGRSGFVAYRATGHVARLNLQRLAAPLDLPLFTERRFEGAITGAFDADGTWTGTDARTLTATAHLDDSFLGGARVSAMDVTAHLDRSRLQITASGDFSGVTGLLAALPTRVSFDLNGRANVQLDIADIDAPFTIEAFDVAGAVALTRSTVQGIVVNQASVDGRLTSGVATVTQLRADIDGGHAEAVGTLALGANGESALTVKASADDLAPLGTIVGQPLAGAGDLEASITGPANHPRAKGHLDGRQLSYGTTASALTVTSTFTADMPNQDLAQLHVAGESVSTFVKVGGLDLVRAVATLAYAKDEVAIDAHLEEQQRQLDVKGLLGFRAAEREVTLRQLALTSDGNVWALPAGTEARLHMNADRLVVENLALTRGDQRIDVAGELGLGANASASPLVVEAAQVQLADLNQALLGTRKLEGLVTGKAVVTGTIKAPIVDAQLGLANAMIENVHVDSAAGRVQFSGDRATVDVTLQQTAVNRLSVTGSVPVRVATDPIDLQVSSSPVDLGLIQAFTTEIEKVSGTGTFDLKVTGTRQSPRVDGTVLFDAGAFSWGATGVAYKDMKGLLEFKDRRLIVNSFALADSDGHTITVAGGLDVPGGTGTALDLRIVADRVHVLDSPLGNVQIDGDLTLGGQLGAPTITGRLRVDRGRIEADRILEVTTKSVYSTTPQGALESAAPTGTPAGAPPAQASLFDRASIDVTLELPDNLVMRGRDLRVGDSSVGLGDMNIIAGGTLDIRKPVGGRVSVLGAMQIVRGYYSFQGRRFDVQRDSTVRFREEPTNPQLNLAADRQISGVTTTVRIQGTASQPAITLSSTPPLEDADILSLIVFGQPVNDLGLSQRSSLSQTAGTMAAGAIATPIADSVARALNLDLFEIQVPNGEIKGPVVALGSQVGTRLYVGVRQELGHESSSLSVEYRIADFLRLVTSIAQGALQGRTLGRSEAGGLDLVFLFRY